MLRKFGIPGFAALALLVPFAASAQGYGWPADEPHHRGGWGEHRAYGPPPGYGHHAPVYYDYHHHHHCRWIVVHTWHGHHRARVCD